MLSCIQFFEMCELMGVPVNYVDAILAYTGRVHITKIFDGDRALNVSERA